ncbi:MAG: outer membrane beta-barrel protein [Melioribacteraceae bacterium]|nr:outer membrane beta-barrel protein [Melioribacteraceae bacterium]
MKRVVYVFIVILAVLFFNNSIFAQASSVGFGGGIMLMQGDNSDEFETGYFNTISYDKTINSYLKLNAYFSYSYVYYEEEAGFFGAYVDNDIITIGIMPKFYTNLSETAQLYIAPNVAYSNVMTLMEIWSPIFDIEDEPSKSLFTFGVNAGVEIKFSENFGIDVFAAYSNMDLGEAFNELEFDIDLGSGSGISSSDMDPIEIETSNINAGIIFKYIF